jgi:hypothetical protein
VQSVREVLAEPVCFKSSSSVHRKIYFPRGELKRKRDASAYRRNENSEREREKSKSKKKTHLTALAEPRKAKRATFLNMFLLFCFCSFEKIRVR